MKVDRFQLQKEKNTHTQTTAKLKQLTVVIFDTGGVEDSRINRAVFDVNINRETNDAHGGEEQGLAE